MLYNNYEDYMRSVLGYSNFQNNTYQPYYNDYNNAQMNQYQAREQLYNTEELYPEIYRIINPLVCQKCDNNNQPITEELVSQMTNEIYDNVVNRIEIQNFINLNIETRKMDESTEKIKKENDSLNCSRVNNRVLSNSNEKSAENRSPVVPASRPRRNRLLSDLIRILILNRLLRPNRPNYGPRPSNMPLRPGFGTPIY